jgi:hypothetical protein
LSDLCLEANLIGDIGSDVVLVVVDVDLVEHIVGEIEIIGARSRFLTRNHIHDQNGLVWILPTSEKIKVGDVCCWVVRDQRSFAMACGKDRRTDQERHHYQGE